MFHIMSCPSLQCPKPVIVAVHGACIGGGKLPLHFVLPIIIILVLNKNTCDFSFVSVRTGVDLITACDIRLCTQDAWFQVKVCKRNILLGLVSSSELVSSSL